MARPHAFRGDRLRRRREQLHLAQLDLAVQTGAGPQQIHRYEAGEAEPSPYQLKRLAKALGVSADYLIGLSDLEHLPIEESSLSPEERRFIEALRQGKLKALRMLMDETLPPE
jgi:transcriptional regulator with XRE-family HTH domain